MSGGALTAAVVVPVLVVLLLLAAILVWRLRTSGKASVCCCGEAASKSSDIGRGSGQDSVESEGGVSMVDLSHDTQSADDSKLMRGRWRTD